jgi:hypothetical protein
MTRDDELPSIPVYSPNERVVHVFGQPKGERIERRVRIRDATDPEREQRAMQQQLQESQTFWRLRYRNRP